MTKQYFQRFKKDLKSNLHSPPEEYGLIITKYKLMFVSQKLNQLILCRKGPLYDDVDK